MKAAVFGTFFARYYPCRWLAAIGLVIMLDVATFMAFSQTSGRSVIPNQDKFMHAAAFFALFTAGHITLHFDFFPRMRARLLPLACNMVFWLGYGAFIELGQKFLSYRGSSLADLAADFVGIVLGAVFVSSAFVYPRSPNPYGKTSKKQV